jgi:hypothetical protein
MAQVAVRAARIVVCALVIPIADHTRSEYEDRDEREGYTDDAKSLLHSSINQSANRNETGAEAIA